MIDRIMVINLDRRRDKFLGWQGAAQACGVDMSKVVRFSAVDGLEFEDEFGVIETGLISFPWWNKVLDDPWWTENYSGRGSMAMRLSFMQVLDQIANGNQMTVFSLDHFHFCRRWDLMLEALERLPEFDIFQLWHWEEPNDDMYYPDYFPTRLADDKSVSYGLAGAGDTILILSPKGAAKILEWWSEKPWLYMDYMLHGVAIRTPLNEQSGILSAVNVNDWAGGPIQFGQYGVDVPSDRVTLDGRS